MVFLAYLATRRPPALPRRSERPRRGPPALVSRLSLSVCYNTRRPCVLQVFARAKDLAWLRHPSQLNADRSALLLAFQPQPFAMNLIRGIDPDSYLLGGWQLGPGGLNTSVSPSQTDANERRLFAGFGKGFSVCYLLAKPG